MSRCLLCFLPLWLLVMAAQAETRTWTLPDGRTPPTKSAALAADTPDPATAHLTLVLPVVRPARPMVKL